MVDIFDLSSGSAGHSGVINYQTSPGRFRSITMSIKSLKEEVNLDHGSLNSFVKQLADRVRTSGWTDIAQIPPDLNDIDANVVDLLITRNGNISLKKRQGTCHHLCQWTEQLGCSRFDADVPAHLQFPIEVSTTDNRPPKGRM